MFTITHHVATLAASDYVARYRDIDRFMGYCRQCGSFDRMWGCPPFADDVAALTDGFAQVTVWGTVITFDDDTRRDCTGDEQRRRISSEAIAHAWDGLLPFLYAQEERCPGSWLFTGRCRLCLPQRCTRPDGIPCRHPDRLRHSLEAVGFDVSATARDLLGIELEWSVDGRLPGTITLVTALFTRQAYDPAMPGASTD